MCCQWKWNYMVNCELKIRSLRYSPGFQPYPYPYVTLWSGGELHGWIMICCQLLSAIDNIKILIRAASLLPNVFVLLPSSSQSSDSSKKQKVEITTATATTGNGERHTGGLQLEDFKEECVPKDLSDIIIFSSLLVTEWCIDCLHEVDIWYSVGSVTPCLLTF